MRAAVRTLAGDRFRLFEAVILININRHEVGLCRAVYLLACCTDSSGDGVVGAVGRSQPGRRAEARRLVPISSQRRSKAARTASRRRGDAVRSGDT